MDKGPTGTISRKQAVRGIFKILKEAKKGKASDMRVGQLIVAALPLRFNNDAFNITDEELYFCLKRFYDEVLNVRQVKKSKKV